MSKMKFHNTLYLAIAFALILGVSSCKQGAKSKTEGSTATQVIDYNKFVGGESAKMLAYLNELGDYVNSRSFPSLIKASSVYEGMSDKQLIIDIRKPEVFAKGHIKNARNVQFEKIPGYFESEIVPFKYDKIIIVSEAGQNSSYTTCLLRLMGYGNVYSMRWGMSGWNKDFADEGWLKAEGSEYQNKLEQTENEKDNPHNLPVLNTGKATGEEILLARVNKLFSEGLAPASLNADKVFADSPNLYIINYIRKDKYDAGHIPGAVRYKPNGTLGIISEMSTIPVDKESVVYCETGHNSGFVTAYLRLFGYNAKTLNYGNNSFMYNKMVAEKDSLSWLPFSGEDVENYPYVKG